MAAGCTGHIRYSAAGIHNDCKLARWSANVQRGVEVPVQTVVRISTCRHTAAEHMWPQLAV